MCSHWTGDISLRELTLQAGSRSLCATRGIFSYFFPTQSLSKCMHALVGQGWAKSSFHTHALLDWVMGRSSS